MEQLPPAVGDDSLGPQANCGPGGGCPREVYEEWWTRGKEYFDYLGRVPKRITKGLNMGDMHDSLLRRWTDEVAHPSALGETVDSKTYGTLLLCNRESERLIYYVTYDDTGRATPGPTTPGLLQVVEQPETDSYNWPWIEGWDDPKRRALILNPKGPKKWTVKRVLLWGGVAAGAVYAGKKMFADE